MGIFFKSKGEWESSASEIFYIFDPKDDEENLGFRFVQKIHQKRLGKVEMANLPIYGGK